MIRLFYAVASRPCTGKRFEKPLPCPLAASRPECTAPVQLKEAAVHTEGPKRVQDEKFTAAVLILGVFCERKKTFCRFSNKNFSEILRSPDNSLCLPTEAGATTRRHKTF